MEPSKPSASLFDVFLRLRPSAAVQRERFLDVEAAVYSAPTHITIKPPVGDTRKRAVERFAFTRVYEEAIGQKDIFQTAGVVQQIQGVLGASGREGRDGLLATLGVTGSGKSHTILGSKSQRGLTQLTLDLLFTQTDELRADVDSNDAIFSSLCNADISEAAICTASQFLDGDVGNTTFSGRMSRAATPAMVRDSIFSTQASPSHSAPSSRLPGTFPEHLASPTPPPEHSGIYDRLYPSLNKYCSYHFSPTRSPFLHLARGASKLTQSVQQAESSFLSAPASKRYLPRVSSLPQSPSIEDISVNIDTCAEYAILISMYEVYNDRIFDLLTPSAASGKASPMKRRALLFKSTELSPDRKVVAGLKKVVCSNLEEALLVLETGLQERKVAGTGSNSASSRSHGFFCVDVKKRQRGRGVPGPWSSSTMTIVDLAGSERARAAKTTGSTLAEAGKINESLMYLGQCMQMQSDNASSNSPALVPFRQCKLTELLFSNSFPHHGGAAPGKSSQKAIMIVTADPLGDFNATSQILRYSALAREVTVPRIPSVSSTILSATLRATTNGRPVTPSAVLEELEASYAEVARLKEQLEVTQLQLQEETQRRVEVEASWTTAEMRLDEVEDLIREEVCEEMEQRMELEMRRWRAQRDVDLDAADEHVDRKIEVFARGMEGGVVVWEDDDKENGGEFVGGGEKRVVAPSPRDDARIQELEDENARLRAMLASSERAKMGIRSPSKKMRVLKTRKWDGEGMGLGDEF